MIKKVSSSFIPAFTWFIIVTVLLCLPGQDVPDESWLDIIYFDKWVHAGLFGGLTFFFSLPYIVTFRATKKLLILIAILSAFYGVLMEYAQKYVVIDRDFDYYDMLADAVGSIIAYFMMIYIMKVVNKNRKVI